MAANEQQAVALTQLPEDVLQNVCQRLSDVCLSVQYAVILSFSEEKHLTMSSFAVGWRS